jgi:hypothetical protein
VGLRCFTSDTKREDKKYHVRSGNFFIVYSLYTDSAQTRQNHSSVNINNMIIFNILSPMILSTCPGEKGGISK